MRNKEGSSTMEGKQDPEEGRGKHHQTERRREEKALPPKGGRSTPYNTFLLSTVLVCCCTCGAPVVWHEHPFLTGERVSGISPTVSGASTRHLVLLPTSSDVYS